MLHLHDATPQNLRQRATVAGIKRTRDAHRLARSAVELVQPGEVWPLQGSCSVGVNCVHEP